MNDEAPPGPRPLPLDAPAPGDPLIGSRLTDRYVVDRLIARGGMARLYRARDERLERDVAVKVLSPPYADDPEFVARFLAEARTAASISHANLVHVYDSGSDGSLHFIVMELLAEHRSLRQVLDERGRLGAAEVLSLGQELLAGLAAAHERGLVHCDVKPANIMLGPGPAKLIDFGIARTPATAAADERRIGSLHIMSPEQLRGEPLTAASDLFAVGVVLYEALTGRVPYRGVTPEELLAAQEARRVEPPSAVVAGVGARLEAAILQSLRVEPQRRFHAARAMARALASAASETRADDTTRVIGPPPPTPQAGYVPPSLSPVPSPAPSPAPSPEPGRHRPRPAPARRTGGLARAAGSAVLLLAAALVVGLVVIPLLDLGRDSDGTMVSTATPAAATPAPAGPTVVVPRTIGLSKDEAIAVARDAGLNWRLECAQDPRQPEGVIDQEPPAGTTVARGAPFTMYSARIQDCRGGD